MKAETRSLDYSSSGGFQQLWFLFWEGVIMVFDINPRIYIYIYIFCMECTRM